jgi:Na+/H+-dicarboxylate symporter
MIKKILTHPFMVMSSILIGVLAGIWFPDVSVKLEGVGGVYLSLLKVTVLPFLFATILVGVVSLLQREGAATIIKRIIIGFIASMVIASAVGVTSVMVTSRDMTPEKTASLGSLVTNTDSGATDLEITLREPMPVPPEINPFSVFGKFIPENIFASLNMGESLKVVMFCLIFGVALGQVKGTGLLVITDALKAVQTASISIFKFLNYFLPFALIAMISSQVAKVGVGIFSTMVEFIGQQALGGVVIMIIATGVLWWRSHTKIGNMISTVRETVIVAISSRSSLSCIPYAQEALVKLGFERSGVELMVPLSFTVNRIGSITYYVIATLFIANIYGIHPGLAGYVVVLLGSILAGLASAGTTGVLTVATVAIVCDLLRLPHEAVIVLLIAVDPIMDMIRTASHVYGNVAVTSFVCSKEETTI